MTIAPNLQLITSVSQLMASTLQDLHRLIESKCNPANPVETMALMMGFTTGLILQLRTKLETLETGLGNKFLDSVNSATQNGSQGLEIIEKLQYNDPSLNQSSSGIAPTDLSSAIIFLTNKINYDLATHLTVLPYILRNDVTVTHALAMLIANLFGKLEPNNINASIDALSANIRLFADIQQSNNITHAQANYN